MTRSLGPSRSHPEATSAIAAAVEHVGRAKSGARPEVGGLQVDPVPLAESVKRLG